MQLPTWEEFSNYLYWEKGLDRNTSHKSRFIRVKDFFSLRELNHQNIGNFFKYLSEELKLSNGTLNNHLKILKHVLFYIGSPYKELARELHRFKEIEPVIETLCKKELERLLKHAYRQSFRYGLIVEVFCKTAIRMSELCNLRNTDFVNNDRLVLRNTKNGTDHQIPLFGDLRDKLNIFLKSEEKKRRPNEWLFGTQHGPPRQQVINEMLQKFALKAGIKKHVSAHKLRHTFGTLAIENDVNPMWLKEFMNHKSIESTMRYVHLSMKSKIDVAKQFPLNEGQLTVKDAKEDASKFVNKYDHLKKDDWNKIIKYVKGSV